MSIQLCFRSHNWLIVQSKWPPAKCPYFRWTRKAFRENHLTSNAPLSQVKRPGHIVSFNCNLELMYLIFTYPVYMNFIPTN